ncbi:hypothetical protein BYT27DRAFT_6572938 [Phlegmacium glaucopus]|nr:hypothetical protein BYT27DRAFT_6572938 [Phlegmacium glaucopus]
MRTRPRDSRESCQLRRVIVVHSDSSETLPLTMTTNQAFFASAASSFHPMPYFPSARPSAPFQSTRNHQRPHDIPPAGMDPQPTDPTVVFMHPPFKIFPNSHLHSDGLTYALMAENPEWFLDANDFISEHNSNPHAISYPPHLEPPRGWCPAKKKDLKERGSEGWPEGEEPRLRCTFCRRTYAGVNAKSMWRRHVFEKHKIAMSNRRDGNDRPRGRTGKENRQHLPSRNRDDNHDNLVSMVVAPQTDPENTSHKSRFRSTKGVGSSRNLRERGRKKSSEPIDEPSTPSPLTKDLPKPTEDNEDFEMAFPLFSPMTPNPSISSDPPNILSEASDELIGNSPAVPHLVVPDTPYDPLQTPSFRHSPPRLPSDQPWRYPSPSHPFHIRTRELSLSMLVPNDPSPITTGVTPAGGSPLTVHSTPLSQAAPSTGFDIIKTPARSKPSFPKPFTKLFRAPTPSPLGFVNEARSNGASPLTLALRSGPRRQRKRPLDISEGWENYLVSSSDISIGGTNNDPFAVYSSWPLTEDRVVSPVRNPKLSEFDSPVVRSGTLITAVGLGIGLLDPFVFPREEPLSDVADSDLKEILSSPCSKQAYQRKRTAMTVGSSPPEPGPTKKRRLTP